MILFVEDEDTIRELTCQFLRLRGLEVEPVASVADAEAAIRRLGDSLQLAVVDHELPDGVGWAVVERIYADRGPLPIIYVSGYYSLPPSGDSDLDENAVTFMRKPYELPELVDAIKSLVAGE